MAASSVDDRREQLVQLVNSEGSVSFQQIKQAFPDVSDMTLRTDLKTLDAERRIIRIHGGARSVEFVIGTDDRLDSRNLRNVDAKMEIAKKAVSLIRPNSTLFLDSGSTTTALAHEMADERSLVFSNSITCATELARLNNVDTIVVGGNLNRYSMSLNGSRAVDFIKSLNFDQLFLGVTSFHPHCGFSCGSDEEATLKRACIKQAEQVIALMDSSKIGRRSTFQFCDLSDIDVLVTDADLPADIAQVCASAGVKVL
ncbi:DeoR/GlpR family DNA-binding transcription regulator [Collinsella tanakaei]|uniref:DeoR/GlpR family DNA-binding transcription regulator n=1 Tax=Collinsella tanakaei TaxID=626935 RepID=UPI0022E734A2|nr:DeoR/GlpR family DNA-binding transcription regulator [Collinsella tanakaei]